MAIRPIIEAPDPRLRVISEPVTEVDDALRALIADMFHTMYDAPGIGLAAVQVGEPRRVLVIDLQEREDGIDAAGEDDPDAEPVRNPRVFINPELYEPSDELSVYNEGCLSVPDYYAEVERPARIYARWLDEHGEAHDEPIDGMLATCLQHEMDHLDGVLFIDHLSRLKREMALRKLEKAKRQKKAA
jgi:peptide deformylase